MWTKFESIGQELSRAWAGTASDCAEFSKLAADALERAELERDLSVDHLAETLFDRDRLPAQTQFSEQFGEPSMVVFRGEAFTIEVLFWLQGLVSIHQHSFAGAFSLLAGSSIHCRYRFEPKQRINAWLFTGEAALLDAELLRTGAVRPIQSGADFIHSTFHLERPSVSIVIRTDVAGQQLEYRLPTVAIDPRAPTVQTNKRLELLRTMMSARPDLYWRLAERAFADADLATCYLILSQGFDLLPTEQRDRLLSLARAVHGEDVNPFLPSLEQSDRGHIAVRLRRQTADPDLRFFLALLSQVPSRAPLLDLIRQRYPGHEPCEKVVECVKQIEIDGVPLVAAEDHRWIALFAELLAGETDRRAIHDRLARQGLAFANDFEFSQELLALQAIPLFKPLLD